MSDKTFLFTLRTPEGQVMSQQVSSIKVSTENGPLMVFPMHANLTGTIVFSRLLVRFDKEEKEFLIRQGLLSVSLEQKSAQILCLSCESIGDVSYSSAKEYLQFIDEKLKAGDNLQDLQLKYLKNEKIAMTHQIKTLERIEKK